MSAGPRIAIIGAGPGGLTLARILHVRGAQSTIFEAESHAFARGQGGTLDLDPLTGQFALTAAGLIDEFRGVARYEDQGMRLLDKDGRAHLDDPGNITDDRPEIDRGQLRDLLVASLPPDVIRWGYKLLEVRPNEHGKYDLIFDSTTVGAFDLVVGADGTWSRVRPLVSSYEPQYTGVTIIELGIDNIDDAHQALSRLVGHGNMAAYGDAKALMAQRNANAHVRVYAAMRMPEDWAARYFDFSNPDAVRKKLFTLYEGWSPALLDLIRVSNDDIKRFPIYVLPVGHRWINRKGVTLLGDAAHVMSPYGGSGVNNAMRDAAELARLLCESERWEEGVKVYESNMFDRVLESAKYAWAGMATSFSHMQIEFALDSIQGMNHAASARE